MSHMISVTTRVGELEAFGYENGSYPVQVIQWDNVTEAMAAIGRVDESEIAVEAPQGVLDTVCGNLCAKQKQDATQSGKEKIRDACTRVLKEGEDRDEVVRVAVTEQQARTAKFIMGASRGGTGGMTKTKAGNVGKALLAKLGDEAIAAMCAEHGLDVSDL